MSVPRYKDMLDPLLTALKQLGGSARPNEVYSLLGKALGLSDDQLTEQKKSGGSVFQSRVNWARFYLAKAGYIDASKYGVWALTESGNLTPPLNSAQINQLIQKVQRENSIPSTKVQKPSAKNIAQETEPDEIPLLGEGAHVENLRKILFSLPASGF